MFNRGDTRICHTIDILQDDICEDPNEIFHSDLEYVSGEPPITISPPTAQIVIDDSDEPECKLGGNRGYNGLWLSWCMVWCSVAYSLTTDTIEIFNIVTVYNYIYR